MKNKIKLLLIAVFLLLFLTTGCNEGRRRISISYSSHSRYNCNRTYYGHISSHHCNSFVIKRHYSPPVVHYRSSIIMHRKPIITYRKPVRINHNMRSSVIKQHNNKPIKKNHNNRGSIRKSPGGKNSPSYRSRMPRNGRKF